MALLSPFLDNMALLEPSKNSIWIQKPIVVLKHQKYNRIGQCISPFMSICKYGIWAIFTLSKFLLPEDNRQYGTILYNTGGCPCSVS